MSSSDFTQRRQEHQGQVAARAEEVQHGSHGKEERAETADEMLDRLLEDMNKPGKVEIRDKTTRLDPKIIDGKGSWRRCRGIDWCSGKGSLSASRGGAGWSGRKKIPESGGSGRSLEEPPGLEVVPESGNGGLLSGLTPGVSGLNFSRVQMEHLPAVTRLSDGPCEIPNVENREEGRSRKDRSPSGKGVSAAVVGSSFALGSVGWVNLWVNLLKVSEHLK